MEGRLQYILGQVNEWLKFAEAKNAALLAVDSALIFAIISVTNEDRNISSWLVLYCYLALVGIIAATAICLISFLPMLKIPFISSAGISPEGQNPIYYGDIANHSEDSYLKVLYESTGSDVQNISDIEKKYAEQIIANSRIAIRKYQLFSIALWITVSCVLTPAVTVLLSALGNYEKKE